MWVGKRDAFGRREMRGKWNKIWNRLSFCGFTCGENEKNGILFFRYLEVE